MLVEWLECHKMPRLPRKTIWQPDWKHSKRRGFAAALIDTARPQENQRLETRHVGAAKRAFHARLPPILTLSTRYKTCWNVTKVPRLPRKTIWQPDWKHSKRRGFAAALIDTARPQENKRLETRHVGAAKRAFHARLPPILTLSTRYKTCWWNDWNVTKCHACHAKTIWQPAWNPPQKGDVLQLPPYRHGEATGKPETRDETRGAFRGRLPPIFTVGDLRKGEVLQLAPQTRRSHRKTRDSRRDAWEQQSEHFMRDFLQFWHFVASKLTFSYVFLGTAKFKPQNRCFVRCFRQFSAHLTKCYA